MSLSELQKYILLQGLENKSGRVSKKILDKFYARQDSPPQKEDQVKIITKSVERLIHRGLARGQGLKTAEKWFIQEVILTRAGHKKAKELLGQQPPLPLKIKKNKKLNSIKKSLYGRTKSSD